MMEKNPPAQLARGSCDEVYKENESAPIEEIADLAKPVTPLCMRKLEMVQNGIPGFENSN